MKKEAFKIVAFQGFGSRKECQKMIKSGLVFFNGEQITVPKQLVETNELVLQIEGEDHPYLEKVFLIMNKPLGVECTRNPQVHESVLHLLPYNLVERGVQPVGRLDVDTTGLLLFSDQGSFIHHVSSPRRNISKVYRVQLESPMTNEQLQALLEGVELRQETQVFKAITAHLQDPQTLVMEIGEGKYHQVRRMIAAVGNHVVGLHRTMVGGVALPQDMLPGSWRQLTVQELDILEYKGV
jgi:16S rRNA pseudouridine516 synthase